MRKQRGQALLLLVALVVLGLTALGLGFIRPATSAINADNRTTQALAQAKDALLGWGISDQNRPGLLPYPDRNADGAYDGYSDCPPQDSNPVTSILLLGKLPVIGEKLPCVSPRTNMGIEKTDAGGETLWYAVSSNLVNDRIPAVFPNIPANLNGATNWLSVSDASGNLLSNQVAFVLLAPGGALPAQDRSAAAPGAVNYLDSYTVGASTYNNWDSSSLSFIAALDTTRVPAGSNQFNERLIYVTRDEYRIAIANRVAGELKLLLSQFYTANGFYPFPAPAADGECVSGTTTGYIPSQDAVPDCAGGALAGLPPDPSWFTDWNSYVAYTLNAPNSATLTIFGKSYALP